MHRGSCLCGAVAFTVAHALPPSIACHCRQCRRQSGHYWISTDVARDALTIADDADKLTWFQSSERVRRGFCAQCGSSLFWDAAGREKIAVAMGAFDAPTDTKLALHIFVAEKGDYYDITDGLPQNER
ncbi:MAG: GFA family protein [Sphingomonas sp.]|nr:GFA family protein [Sphingomonas sp.]